MKIQSERVAAFHYKLKNDLGEVISASSPDNPLVYLHGSSAIIPGLEKELTGKEAGDKLTVVVSPEEGYGLKHDELITVLKREVFTGIDEIVPGMQFQAQDDSGDVQVITVVAVEDDRITVDRNHPLAGEVLNFEVEIVSVREAADHELLAMNGEASPEAK